MRIILERALFDVQSEPEATSLLDIFANLTRDPHRHALITDPVYEPGGANGELDIWLSKRESYEANVLRTILNNGLLADATFDRGQPVSGPRLPSVISARQPRIWRLAGPTKFHVERRPDSDWRNRRLTLRDAANLLREPARVLVENGRTEPAFLVHLAGPTDGASLQELLRTPAKIVLVSGGCGELKRWVQNLSKPPETQERWRQLLRAWVLFDWDAGESSALDPSQGAIDLMCACEDAEATFGYGLSWIALRRRELESYIPDSGLRAQRAERLGFAEQVIAWRGDNDRKGWAWALDLKKGLLGDLRAGWDQKLSKEDKDSIKQAQKPLAPEMLKAPFSGLSNPLAQLLTTGFGDAIGRALRGELGHPPPWTVDIPAEYDRGPDDQVSREALVRSLFDRM